MNIRHLGLAVVTAAIFSPSISNASPEKASVEACAHAFATSIASIGAPAPSYKLAYRGNPDAGSLVEFYRSGYSFDLEAHDQKTGLTVARARCSTGGRGTVVALSVLPLDRKTETLAAEF
jgi:hypothetical protein